MGLTVGQKFAIHSDWATEITDRREPFDLNMTDLDEAVTAVDQRLDDNAAAFHSSLPVAARTALTAAQKAELLYRVALKRFGG